MVPGGLGKVHVKNDILLNITVKVAIVDAFAHIAYHIVHYLHMRIVYMLRRFRHYAAFKHFTHTVYIRQRDISPLLEKLHVLRHVLEANVADIQTRACFAAHNPKLRQPLDALAQGVPRDAKLFTEYLLRGESVPRLEIFFDYPFF